jgi:catechol 2,3-dioxygenase-like lactoylglutathione lyase family enzyme
MRTYKDAKAMARSLRESLVARNVSLSHSECLEIVARQFGWSEWNSLSAALDIQAGRVTSPQTAGVSFQPPIPVLRVTSMREAKAFYADFLGFEFQWGFEPEAVYSSVVRGEITLHLDAGEAKLSGGAGVLIRLSGVDALHAELGSRSGRFSASEITFTPWDSRVFHVIDPFGNGIRFWENNPPGVARPLEGPRR